MKKIFAFFAALALTGQMAIGQGVSDLEVIPVSVTINTVLRLNVVRGGNIEFVINTLDNFKNGIITAEKFQTEFTVAASRDFDVNMLVEDATFIGTDKVGNTLPLSNVGFTVTATGTYVPVVNYTVPVLAPSLEPLVTGSNPIVQGIAGATAGDITDNKFTIDWECNTPALVALNGVQGNLLHQSVDNDRYTTNVYLELEELP